MDLDACYAKGYSTRMAMVETGLSKEVVLKRWRVISDYGYPRKCPCGHQDWHFRGCKWRRMQIERRKNWKDIFGTCRGPFIWGVYDQHLVWRMELEKALTPEQKEKREWQKARRIYREVVRALNNPRHLQSLREVSRQGKISPS